MPQQRRNSALTLVEVMVASAVFVVIAVALYSLMRSGTLLRERLENQESLSCAAYLNLEVMARELRNAFIFKPDTGALNGDASAVTFYSRLYDHKNSHRYAGRVSYVFRDNALYKSLSVGGKMGDEYIFIDQVRAFKLAYYNKESLLFEDSWKDKDVLPQCIKVDLEYGDGSRVTRYISWSGR